MLCSYEPGTQKFFSSIMSGDSPNAHTNNVFDYLEGRSSPTPTTSKEANPLVSASVLVEPSKAEEKERNSISFPGAKARDSSDQSKLLKLEDTTELDGKDPPKDINESNEKLNAKWVPPPSSVKGDNDDDENCIVKCLYYTMQCCECTII